MTSASADPAADRAADPVAELAARLDGVAAWLSVRRGFPSGPGWARCSDVLADPGALPRWLGGVARAVQAQNGGWVPPLVTPASYLMGWYLDVPAYTGGLAFGVARRVPDLDQGSLAVHLAPGGWPDGVALLGDRFACLPDDPDADHPAADVVRDERALAQVLRDRVAAHARAFHSVYRPPVKIGSRQRWGMLTDVLDTALWTSGVQTGDEERGVRDAGLVLDGVHPPFTSGSRVYRLVDGCGRPRWTRRRESCCFLFHVPGAQACFTCPRVGDDERVARATDEP